MNVNLPSMEMPQWLRQILDAPKQWQARLLPVKEILTDSLYYPCCGLDWTPVNLLAGNVYTFVYADYKVRQRELLANLYDDNGGRGIEGYEVVYQQDVVRDVLVPANWRPPIQPVAADGRLDRLHRAHRRSRPFSHWSVWRRLPDYNQKPGPEGFSLLYLGGEACALYQCLYNFNRVAPRVLAIIQPGGHMCDGWTMLDKDDSYFERIVASNPAGLPKFLVCGGNGGDRLYQNACWRRYEGKIVDRLKEHSAGIWRLNS